MKKNLSFIFLILLVACSSINDSDSVNEVDITTTTSIETTSTSIDSADPVTTIEPTIQYVFDVERMSPFTGKELPPETWLKRPKRVIAFKIDNNINARPQSGLQEADAVHEILVEGGDDKIFSFFL